MARLEAIAFDDQDELLYKRIEEYRRMEFDVSLGDPQRFAEYMRRMDHAMGLDD